MPRNDLKAYTTVLAGVLLHLVGQVKQYASQHRCTVSELIRDGLEMRLEAGEVPGRSTLRSADHGEEVIHEVLQIIPEVIQRISPMLLAQFQDTIRTTVTEVFHGMTEILPGHTSTPQAHAPITEQGITEVFHDKADFDATRFVLGKLCINAHAYGATGQTLYRLPKYVCLPCDAARARERRARRKAAQQEG